MEYDAVCVCKIGNEKLRKRDSATKLLSEKVIKKESEGDFSGLECGDRKDALCKIVREKKKQKILVNSSLIHS